MALPPQINDRVKDSFVSVGSRDSVQQVLPVSGSGDSINLDSDGNLEVVQSGLVCDCNSSSTPLAAGATFTGTNGSILDYAIIYVNVYSDVASATDGLEIQFSSDGVTYRTGLGDVYTIPANTEKTFSLQCHKKFFRVVYTNGGTDQTVFDLQVVLKKTNGKPSSHRIQDSISNEDDAELVKAVLTGEDSRGDFINASLTNGGNFKTSLEELESGVSVNSNTQLKTTLFDSSGSELFSNTAPARVDLPSTYFDAFGRLKSAEAFDLFDNTNVRSYNPWLMKEKITGSATINYNYNQSAVELKTTTANGDRAIRQSRYLPYVPGKGQYIDATGVILESSADTNCKRKIGFFDDRNGIFYQHDGSNFSINIRSDVSGAVVDTQVIQSNFNIDKLDGAGVSGINLDFTKTLIFQIEFQWLGVGSVIFSIVVDGKILRCHQSNHSNNLSVVYMRTPCLPIRYEIENTGTVSTAQTLKEICCSVGSSGGFRLPQTFWAVGPSDTNPLNSNDGESDIFVIRLKSQFDPDSVTGITENRVTAFLKNINYYTEQDNVRFRLIKIIGNVSAVGNINLSTSFTSVNQYSACEYYIWDGSLTRPLLSGDYEHTIDDRILKGGGGTPGTGTFSADAIDEQFVLSQNIDSNESEYYVVRGTNLETGNSQVAASMQWYEVE